jgi:hypothetical protein
VFENRVLRRLFGSKRDEVTGGWRQLHNEALHNLYSSPSIIRMVEGVHVARMEDKRSTCWILVGKPEGKRPLGRPKRKWVDNIKSDLREMGCGGMDWIDLSQDRNQWRALVKRVA